MLTEGSILSHYKVVSAIGAGGMGEVYLAEDTKLGRQVALKVLLSEVSSDQERVGRFVQEAKAASALNHPNILTVHEIGNVDGARYIATEFIKGETLRERMKNADLTLLEGFEIALQITAALGAAHEAGIIHRDIKPENIMIRGDGLVKVLDFGLAKLLPMSAASIDATLPQHETRSGVVVGTVAYMSPEQARGRTLDPRSDIFSLGIVLFELFCRQRPFVGDTQLDLVSSILRDDPPGLRQISPDLPRDLEKIVDKTLRKDRDHRYQTIRDLHIDIEDLRDELKFEAKQLKSVHPTIEASIHNTKQDSSLGRSTLRSALTTGISQTRRFTLLHALIFMSVTLAILAGIWYLAPSRGLVGAGPYKTTEVATWTSAPGELFGSASFSPNGELIAFASTRSGTKGIWVTQTSSMEAIPVTTDEFSNTDPIWSSKGDEIAFVSQRPNASGVSSYGIWRVGALGGAPRSIGLLADASAKLRRWTASGKIYYEMRRDLHAMDVATGTSQKVTSLDESKPVWINIAPDEKTIAYATADDDNWQIHSMELGGSKTSELAKGRGRLDKYVSWLPEKDRLYMNATIDDVTNLLVTVEGSGKNDLIATPEIDSSIVDAAPDGRSIILSSAREESNLWSVSLAGGGESPVAKDLNAKLWPAVSPDGSKVAFHSIKNLSAGNRLLRANIAVKPLKGTDSDRPTVLTTDGSFPTWSPDGSTVAFLKLVGRDLELFSVSASGGGERQLAKAGLSMMGFSLSPYNAAENRSFAWSPDGSRIAFIASRGDISNLCVVSIADGVETQVTKYVEGSSALYSPVWSSDGTKIAFSYHNRKKADDGRALRGLRVVDVTSGAVSEVLETTRLFRLLGWTSDENGLMIAEPSKEFSGLPPETKVTRVPLSGTESMVTGLKNVYFYNMFLSADRKHLAYAARNQNLDDLWVMPSAGGAPRKLTDNKDSGQYFSRLAWTPNGEAIVFGKQTRFSLLSLISDIN